MKDDDLRATYNKISEDFAEDHYKDDWDDDYIELFVKSLENGSTVLDLGCGAGNDTVKLTKLGLSVEGLDLSDGLIKIAKKRAPKLKFTQGNMLDLPYDNMSFDGVFAKASILHITKTDVPKVLAEIKRVLKPDGIIHIAIKGGEGEGVITEDDYGYKYQRFFSYWKMEDIITVLEKNGFKVIKHQIWRRTPESFTTWLKIVAKMNP